MSEEFNEALNSTENPAEEAVLTEKKPEKFSVKDVVETIIYLLVVFVLCLLFTRFVAYRCIVKGSSMEMTFEEGDNAIAERISYYLHDPRRFDVVVLDLEEEQQNGTGKDTLIKRVIGLPGETVSIHDGYVHINGERLSEDIYAVAGYTAAYPEITLGDDEFFVLGDNRDISRDSRSFGPVKKDAIKSRILVRIWPLNKIGTDFKQP